MKNLFISIIFFVTTSVFSQIIEPVKWTTKVEKKSSTEYDLIATAHIDETWHIYSQNAFEFGPLPTVFTFTGNSNYLKKGNTKEETGITLQDPTFNMQVTYFEVKTNFKQRIKLKAKTPFKIEAEVNYMVCNDTKCIMAEPEMLTFNIQ